MVGRARRVTAVTDGGRAPSEPRLPRPRGDLLPRSRIALLRAIPGGGFSFCFLVLFPKLFSLFLQDLLEVVFLAGLGQVLPLLGHADEADAHLVGRRLA